MPNKYRVSVKDYLEGCDDEDEARRHFLSKLSRGDYDIFDIDVEEVPVLPEFKPQIQ